jgi:hypothetical protein
MAGDVGELGDVRGRVDLPVSKRYHRGYEIGGKRPFEDLGHASRCVWFGTGWWLDLRSDRRFLTGIFMWHENVYLSQW